MHHNYAPTEELRTDIVSRLEMQHNSHSQTEEPKIGNVSRLETLQCITATYRLSESQGQALLAS